LLIAIGALFPLGLQGETPSPVPLLIYPVIAVFRRAPNRNPLTTPPSSFTNTNPQEKYPAPNNVLDFVG
jgi:hypothetical protein